jgi:hypothetical protein
VNEAYTRAVTRAGRKSQKNSEVYIPPYSGFQEPETASGYAYHPSKSSIVNKRPIPRTADWKWWIPPDGIDNEAIETDLERYLGPGAACKAGRGDGRNEARNFKHAIICQQVANANRPTGYKRILD